MPIVGVKKAVAREEGEGGGCDGGGRCGGGCDGGGCGGQCYSRRLSSSQCLCTKLIMQLLAYSLVERLETLSLSLLHPVEGIQVHANEGGVTQTRGGIYWLILPAGCNNSLLP
ncbi:hypothetical protein LINGRAHAP2_LOCUS28199 [Linum grandiflorum]